MAPEPLSLPLHKPKTITDVPSDEQHTFSIQRNTAGECKIVRRRIFAADEPTACDPVPQYVPVLPRMSVSSTIQPASSPLPTVARLPYSTRHYRRRKLEEEMAGTFKRTYTRTTQLTLCRKCGQDKNSGGHRQHYGNIYCPNSSEFSYEQWKEQFLSKYKKQKK